MSVKYVRVICIFIVIVCLSLMIILFKKLSYGNVNLSKDYNNKITYEEVNYYPKIKDKLIINPYMGLAPDASAENTSAPFSLVYAGVSWKDLEPEKGKYNFEDFEKDKNFKFWKENDKNIILRLLMEYPSGKEHMDIPQWLYNEINKEGFWYDNKGNKGFSPDYKNEVLIENHRRLLKALGERYGNDDFVAFIELGSIGHWGEWHTTYIPEENEAFPKSEITDRYF